ncbi:MAG: hypothetical protein QXI12_00465 [Candidatus Methanomethyliaceae archaeon]
MLATRRDARLAMVRELRLVAAPGTCRASPMASIVFLSLARNATSAGIHGWLLLNTATVCMGTLEQPLASLARSGGHLA